MSYEVQIRNLGHERDDRNELVIANDGLVLATFWDGGEPEDNTFSRDWRWIASELRRAYELGKKAGESRVPTEPGSGNK